MKNYMLMDFGFLILGNGHPKVEASLPLEQGIIMFTSQLGFTKYFLRGRHTKIIKTHTLSLRISKNSVSKNIREVDKICYEQRSSTAAFNPLPQGLEPASLNLSQSFLS